MHLQSSNTERLYLPRKEVERGLENIIHKNERIELKLYQTLNEARNIFLKKVILYEIQALNPSIATIYHYLANIYNIINEISIELLVEV
jgi:hypothetical protein